MQQSSSEYERWEGRFGGSDYAFGKEPNYFLAACKPLLPRSGKVLAVADGEGRNGVWLAEQGLDVLSIDFSPSAQRKARALAQERGVTVSFLQADVHAFDYPQAAFDVVVEIFTQFSSPAERADRGRVHTACLPTFDPREEPGALAALAGICAVCAVQVR